MSQTYTEVDCAITAWTLGNGVFIVWFFSITTCYYIQHFFMLDGN